MTHPTRCLSYGWVINDVGQPTKFEAIHEYTLGTNYKKEVVWRQGYRRYSCNNQLITHGGIIKPSGLLQGWMDYYKKELGLPYLQVHDGKLFSETLLERMVIECEDT